MVIHSHNYSLSEQFERYYAIASSLRHYKWIFEYVRPEGEGIRFLKEQVRFVLKQRKYLWIPYIFLESGAKYAGYRIGLIAG
jgi:rhamnosyltransferase